MKTRALWSMLVVALVVALGCFGPSRAADYPSGAPTAASASVRHVARQHHHHHHRRLHRLASLRAREHRAELAAASLTVRAVPSCSREGDLMSCDDVIAVNHELVMANRAAAAAGVPLPILRVGFDEWLSQRDQAAHTSHEALLAAYNARLVFVRRAVADKPDWRSIYPPIQLEATLA